MTKRVLLGNDDNGWTGFRCTLPGYDAMSVLPTEYHKLVFDSAWDSLQRIHQSGTFRNPDASYPFGDDPLDRRITFPDLGFIPMVSVRRKSTLSGGTVYGDEWYTQSGGGTDPYRNTFVVFPYSNSFRLVVEPLPVTRSPIEDDFPGPWYMDYIVWNLPIIGPQVYT